MKYVTAFRNISNIKEQQHTLTKGKSRKRELDNDVYDDTYLYYTENNYDSDDDNIKGKKKYTKTNNTSPNENDNSTKMNCPVCYDEIIFPYITDCNHQFCYSCINKLISVSKSCRWACPICRKMCKT